MGWSNPNCKRKAHFTRMAVPQPQSARGTGLPPALLPAPRQMFDDLLEKAGGQVSAVRFGHLLSPQAAPRALLAEGTVQGYPKVLPCRPAP